MIKKLIFLAFAVSIAVCIMKVDCNCGTGFYVNEETSQCQPYPSFGETGYVDNCTLYKFQVLHGGGSAVYCDKCSETYYLKTIALLTEY